MENQIRGSRRSTSRKRDKKPAPFWAGGVCLLVSSLVFFSGCGPKYTYPARTVSQSIEALCQKEYRLDVEARVVGRTVGAVLYVDEVVDPKGQVPKETHEKMWKVMQVVTRVALSTDLPLDFCVILIRDRADGNELSMTRSVDDTKRANADAIGIEESFNRTLFGQGRYAPRPNGKASFLLKEVRLENFLTDQIVQRIRYHFSKDARDGKEAAPNPFIFADGELRQDEGGKVFRFSVFGMKEESPRANILAIFKVVNDVLYGYAFTAFDAIEIQDYLNRQKLVIGRQTLLDFQQKKIKEAEILEKFLTESQSIQEAFKLFGFSLPAETAE